MILRNYWLQDQIPVFSAKSFSGRGNPRSKRDSLSLYACLLWRCTNHKLICFAVSSKVLHVYCWWMHLFLKRNTRIVWHPTNFCTDFKSCLFPLFDLYPNFSDCIYSTLHKPLFSSPVTASWGHHDIHNPEINKHYCIKSGKDKLVQWQSVPGLRGQGLEMEVGYKVALT